MLLIPGFQNIYMVLSMLQKMGITLSNQIIYVVVIFALRLHLMSVLVIVLMLLECLYLLLIR